MNDSSKLRNTIPSLRTSLSRSPLRRGFLFIALVLAFAWFALSPTARAVDPPPDGGYPNQNTAEGDNALLSLTSGADNTAMGFNALTRNTMGKDNTANGSQALTSNTTGDFNTANGCQSLFSNITGAGNTANGSGALLSNTTGNGNTANGVVALYSNTTGGGNTANGAFALFYNFIGMNNTANGAGALEFNGAGSNNTANGAGALANTNGSSNTANGAGALGLSTTGNDNIALGTYAGINLTTGSNNIDIGAPGAAGESGTIRIGTVGTQTATFIAGISGATVPGGVAVVIDANGHLGVRHSSARFKDEIKPMDKASEAILALKPVTFRYKHELDPEGIPQFGLVAEQVEKVSPDLVARDDAGKPYTVRYEAVNAMLLNEFLKEHRIVEEQEATITELKSADTKQEATIAQLKSTVVQQQQDFQVTTTQLQKEFEWKIAHQQKQIEALTAGLQRVSDGIEVSKRAPQMVLNTQ